MLNAFRSLGQQRLEFARYAPRQYDRYKIIRVEALDPSSKRFDTILRNIMLTNDSMVVQTADRYDYAPRQHLFFRNKWWEIQSVTEIPANVAPQSLALVSGGNTEYALEISEVNGYDLP